MRGRDRYSFILMVAVVLIVATISVSCKGKKIKTIDAVDIASVPTQKVENMHAVQSENGIIGMKMSAPVLERYDVDENNSYEDFPLGINVFGYNSEGLLETKIVSDKARHTTSQNKETWAAYGNVVVINYEKGEKIETDTLYWDRQKKTIYTDCYVKLSSPQGLMQGYGLESDERARNAVLLRPFDSYVINRDTTVVFYVDSANFIGPLYKR